MIIRKETTQKDTLRMEWIGRELTENEKRFVGFMGEWMVGVMSAKDEGFTHFAIKQLSASITNCSAYLKQNFPYR